MTIPLFGIPNWELLIWSLIEPHISEKCHRFSSAQIMREKYESIYKTLKVLGHKKAPKAPEATMRRTLENMRDKGWIEFYGQGEYELTENGYNYLVSLKESIGMLKELSKNIENIEI
jgi:DNA-binding PadR family transcriptional regulator